MAFSQSINGLVIEQSPVTISLTKSSNEMFKIPRNCYENLFVERVVDGSRNIFWSAPIDFKLPEDTMDQLLKRDGDVKSAYGVLHLSLAERLGGWKIEKRQRLGLKIHDKYFYHNQSGKMFRSFGDVVRFIKDASLPKKGKETEKEKEMGKGKGKGSSSSEEVTPHSTPKRGSEYLRRFNNEQCNMSQGNEESQVEGGSITIIPDLFIPDEDLVCLEDFGRCVNNND